MSYGLNISASGLMTSVYAQEVWANNLANMDTPGFKPDIPVPMARESARREDGLGFLPSNALLERLGGGTLMHPSRVDFTQGRLRETGGALDLAILGEGFFVVGGGGDARLTRDGRFVRRADGTLVTSTGGTPVLDVHDKPIRLGAGSVEVDDRGRVLQQGREVARLKVVEVVDTRALRRLDKGQFAADRAALAGSRPARGLVMQHRIEEAAGDEVQALMRMTSAAREVEGNVSMIQAHDRLLERAIGLGRVG